MKSQRITITMFTITMVLGVNSLFLRGAPSLRRRRRMRSYYPPHSQVIAKATPRSSPITSTHPSPLPSPSPGLVEWTMPPYDPPQETQELIPPSPLPSLVPRLIHNRVKKPQSYLGLPTPFPKYPNLWNIYHHFPASPTPSPNLPPAPTLPPKENTIHVYSPQKVDIPMTYSLGSSLLVMPPVIFLDTNGTASMVM
jgi:hypothetical protein